MRLPPLPLLVLDTETTGFVPRTHRVIEFACVRCEGGKIVEEYEQLFACKEVPPIVEVLTRISTANLADMPPIAEKRDEILACIPDDAVIVGQNIGFDIKMLKGEGLDLSGRPWIDTSMLASMVFPELESYSLGYLSEVLELSHEPKHRAMGDVRATMELLGKCWERFLELPAKRLEEVQAIMARAPEGYRRFFAALPEAGAAKDPAWLRGANTQAVTRKKVHAKGKSADSAAEGLELPAGEAGTVNLLEEPLDPHFIERVIAAALADPATVHWIAVKNLDAHVRRLPRDLLARTDVRVLYPPQLLLDRDAAAAFLGSENFTADEATLAAKLRWYAPRVREDFPLHGDEEAVWNGKLACTAESTTYLDQFKDLPAVLLLDHRQLLTILCEPEHPAHATMKAKTSIVVDDASMLEDTATKSFGWYCAIDDLRAAAEGGALLTKFLDVFQLWIEKVRQFQDLRYLVTSDLQSPDAKGLREQLAGVMSASAFSPQVVFRLECLAKMLDPANLSHRIAYIEQRQNGSQSLHSVPDRVGTLLADTLYARLPTTLLIPPGSAETLTEILPPGIPTIAAHCSQCATRSPPLTFDHDGATLDAVFANPPAGKTILLLPGKGAIEELFVRHRIALEDRGVAMICQGVSGGHGRMQAEILAAEGAALWLLTPWTFESIDLPTGTVDRLFLKALPFDHPRDAIFSRRSEHYRAAFDQYSLPRLEHRLFRVLRTFCRFRKPEAGVRVLDERLFSKTYGKRVREYLERITDVSESSSSADKPAPRESESQLSMF